MAEIWKTIPSFPGYEASNDGRIRLDDRLLTIGKTHDGYPRVTICGKKKNHSIAVHALVCEAFHGPRPRGFDCCHNDGTKDNNKPDNLRWDTRKNNCADIIKHGRTPRGEKNGLHKFKDHQIKEMREKYANGAHWSDLVKEYGIGRSHLYFILRRDRWFHI